MGSDYSRYGLSPDANWQEWHAAAHKVIVSLCSGERQWTMSVPARRWDDTDLIISSALDASRDRIAALEAEVERLQRDLDKCSDILRDFVLEALHDDKPDEAMIEVACSVLGVHASALRRGDAR